MSYQIFIYNTDTDYFQLENDDANKLVKNLGFDNITYDNVQDFENALDTKYNDFKFFVDLDGWYGQSIVSIGITANSANYKTGNENANYQNIVDAVASFKNVNDLTTVFDIVDENNKKTTV